MMSERQGKSIRSIYTLSIYYQIFMMHTNPFFPKASSLPNENCISKKDLNMEVMVGEGSVDNRARTRERKAGRKAKTATGTSKLVVKLKPLGVGDFAFLHEITEVHIRYILEET